MRLIDTLSAASLLATAGMAMAQTGDAGNDKSMIEVLQSLEAEGYSAFEDIDREHNHYDVTATDANGVRVELEVDLQNAEVLRSERED
ncbi:MAG: PepSY domain-containing protein [Salinisphaeraceae bacterium]